MTAERVDITVHKEKKDLGECQAEVHAPEFYKDNGRVISHNADTVDHLTPPKIARVLSWKSDDYKNLNARVPMHRMCHELKDGSTPARIALAKQIKHSGTTVTLEDYKCIRRIFDTVYVDPLERNGNGYHGEIIIETDLLE